MTNSKKSKKRAPRKDKSGSEDTAKAKSVRCGICGNLFSNKSKLKLHRSRKHPNYKMPGNKGNYRQSKGLVKQNDAPGSKPAIENRRAIFGSAYKGNSPAQKTAEPAAAKGVVRGKNGAASHGTSGTGARAEVKSPYAAKSGARNLPHMPAGRGAAGQRAASMPALNPARPDANHAPPPEGTLPEPVFKPALTPEDIRRMYNYKYTPKNIPPGKFACSKADCFLAFDNPEQVAQHMHTHWSQPTSSATRTVSTPAVLQPPRKPLTFNTPPDPNYVNLVGYGSDSE